METFARMESLQNDTNKIVNGMTGRTPSAFTFSPLDLLIGTHSLWAEALNKIAQFSADSAQRRYASRILKQMKSNNIDDLQAAYRDLYQNQNMSNKAKMFVNDNLGKAIRQRATVAGATAMGRKEGGRVGYDEGGDVRAGDSVGGYKGDTGGSSGDSGGNENVRADTVSQSQQASSDSQAAANDKANRQDVSPFAFGKDVNVSGNVGAAPSQGDPSSIATPHLDYVNSLVDKIQGPESSYGQNTYNMSSGAFGPWGLTPATALSQLTQTHPEMLNQATGQVNPGDVSTGGLDTSQDPSGVSNSTLLRNIVLDRNLQRDLVTNLTQQNMATLAANGFDTSPQNVYAAHMLGVNDAMKVLRSNGGSSLQDTGINPKAITGNKLQGMSVNDFLNHTQSVMAKAPTAPSAPTAGRTFQNKGGRVTRATGGRIPEVDKVFKAAKRELDGHTKSMLHMHDDAIVHALRIAKGKV